MRCTDWDELMNFAMLEKMVQIKDSADSAEDSAEDSADVKSIKWAPPIVRIICTKNHCITML
jgi:hypothetical protein